MQYKVDPFSEENGNQYFSCDESEFSHDINSESIWVLGMTNNTTKDFRVVATKIRDTIHLKEFITRYISPGNKIITDGWAGYDWADSPNSGYIRYRHIHGQHDFGFGIESTSHVETIWAQLKMEIKTIYKTIPGFNFLYYLKEAE